jgi:hypothetical protein
MHPHRSEYSEHRSAPRFYNFFISDCIVCQTDLKTLCYFIKPNVRANRDLLLMTDFQYAASRMDRYPVWFVAEIVPDHVSHRPAKRFPNTNVYTPL